MLRPKLVAFLLLPAFATAHAGWKDDTGHTRLQQTFTSGVPTGVAGGITQAEAGDTGGNNYLPDAANGAFTGKTITNKSTGSGTSGHATSVGGYFYGTSSSLIPATVAIDAYNANGWLNTDFLNFGLGSYPLVETRRVQNHSWISNGSLSDGQVTHADLRLDYAINRDGFVSVVGVNNGTSTTLPGLMCQGYHTISVGLVNGQHSAGITAFDTPGRMKPDLVGFEGLTSFATPQVASAAGLVSEKLRNTSYSPALATADYPRLTKALLLAGAAKDPLASWSRTDTTKPYDARYGAGALNVFLAYRILLAGNFSPSDTATVDSTGWSVDTALSQGNGTTRTYFFDIPAGSASTRFSAVLVWHRVIDNSLNPTVANLDLKLCAVADGTFDVGSVLDSSISTVDNVEHVYQASLAPGRYAVQVTRTSGASTIYALAWRSSPTVTVAATSPVARELDGSPATFTLTRTGPVTSPLLVPLAWGGSAVSGTHYTTPAASVLIPAGSSAATVQITPLADSVAQGDRTVSLTVATDFSLSAGVSSSATATLEDKPYDAWRFARFTTVELADTATSGDSADPDADSLSNLMEYALGTEPKTVDPVTTAPGVGTSADRLTLTYTRPTALADVNYVVEWSGNLQDWSTGAAVTETVSSTSNGNGTTTVIVRTVAPLSTTPRQFLRLRITRL
ncbi:MAG: fibronectin [Rariglobus sp.]|jgi:hypothetical protein|nr:fibronectin [Rariglobus sp.]